MESSLNLQDQNMKLLFGPSGLVNSAPFASKGTPIRYILGKSKILLGLTEGIPIMMKGEVAMVISEDLGVVKKLITEGQGWETPRQPYEVKAR